jgi:hypothetical protein
MGSHTATGEWQSFEQRMRRRRAERLLERAQAAANAGLGVEARAYLDEARRLAPALPDVAAVEEALTHPRPVHASRRILNPRYLAVAAGIVALAVGGALAMRPTPEPRAIAPAAETPAPAIAIPPPVRTPAEPVVAEPPTAAPSPSEPVESTEPPLPRLAPEPVAIAPRAAPRRRVETPAAIPVNAGVTPGTADVVAAIPRAAIEAEPAPAVPTEHTEPADADVRRALDRYAAAYGALDAAAAARVWPEVDRAALARAFDALESQHVALGTCAVDVSAASARANCDGTATWTPKVGARVPRTEPRRWTFELTRAGSDWQIVRARVQNR